MIRAHLLAEVKPRNVGPACKPEPSYSQQYKGVCVVLRRRMHDVKQMKANQIKAAKTATEVSSVFNMRPSVEQVTEQWMRALIKKGLSLDLVDDSEFRAAVLMTARAGLVYVDAATGQPKLPHRTYKGADVKRIVQEERHWKEVFVAVGTLEPIIRVLRLTDGKSGATLGKVYDWCANITANYLEEIVENGV